MAEKDESVAMDGWKTAVNFDEMITQILTWEKEGVSDGWELLKEAEGAKSWKKQPAGESLPIVKVRSRQTLLLHLTFFKSEANHRRNSIMNH